MSQDLQIHTSVNTSANEETFQEQLHSLEGLIAGLYHLNEENKAWARSDAQKRLKAGEDIEELRQKYLLYNQLGEVRENIEEEVSDPKKRKSLSQWIDAHIINPSSQGQDRRLKLEKLQKVYRTVDLFRRSQENLKFIVEKNVSAGDIDIQVLSMLDEGLHKRIAKIFPDKFWELASKMSPQAFPHFTQSFDFMVKQTFPRSEGAQNLPVFAEKIKAGIQNDTEEILMTFFTDKEADHYRKTLKSTPPEKALELVKVILSLKDKQETRHFEAQKVFDRAYHLSIERQPKAAFSEIQALQQKYGPHALGALGKQSFLTKLELKILRIENLEKQIKSTKDDAQRKKLTAQLAQLQETNPLHIKQTNVDPTQDQQKQKASILKEMGQFRRQGDLKAAKASAQRLLFLDRSLGERELKRLDEDMQKKSDVEDQKDTPSVEAKIDVGYEKEMKIKFLEKCLEHAEKIMETCEQTGIPKDDPKFWREEGTKNRIKWLKENGFYETYRRFNSSDPNMPKDERIKGIRFRWLDAQTGSNLSLTRATNGLKYLQRYKESGYILATLAGGLSLNWNTSGPNYRTPDEFIRLVTEELHNVRGTSAQEKKAA